MTKPGGHGRGGEGDLAALYRRKSTEDLDAELTAGVLMEIGDDDETKIQERRLRGDPQRGGRCAPARWTSRPCAPSTKRACPGRRSSTPRRSRIKALRERNHVSQPVFARYLNTSESTVQKWETGAKRPSGLALKLLSVVEKHGLQVLQ